MHLQLKEVGNIAGFSAENTCEKSMAKILVRASIISDDPVFYTYTDQLSQIYLTQLKIFIDHVYQFLIIIHKNLSADVYINDFNVETQKKGRLQMGDTLKTDPRIKMEHFIVFEQDGLINSIFLILNPNRFVTVDRFYGKVFDNEEVAAFAAKVADRIQKGESFESLVKQYSQDNYTKNNGGDVGYFTAGQINSPEIEDAAYSTEPGHVYPHLIKSGYGYHIIKITEKYLR